MMGNTMDWEPLTDLDEVEALDDAEKVEGYRDGRANEPRPGPNRSDAYRHGWWTGQRDGGHREAHPTDAILAKEHQRRAKAARAARAAVKALNIGSER